MTSCTRTCPLACGDHGRCNACTGQCDCDAGWNGTLCQNPDAGVACQVSDDTFRKAHNGGDKDCGNYGSYGRCNADGTCACTNGFKGSRCERACDTDDQCGGSQQSRPIGICNMFGQCECKNGWSGPQCKTPPPGVVQCQQDDDCGWGGAVNGKCQTDKRCKCNTDPSAEHAGRPMFDGPFCTNLIQYEGAPCKTDKDCLDGNKCHVVGNEMVCYTPDQSPATKLAHLKELIESFFTLENLVLMFGQSAGEQIATYLATQVGGVTLGKALEKVMLDNAETLVSKDALASMTKYLPEAMASRVAARMAGKEAIEQTAGFATKVIAEEIVAGAFGAVFSAAGMFQIFGMVLDMFDARGLNQQMHQSLLDQQQRGFAQGFNQSESARKNSLFMPKPVSPTESVGFNLELKSQANLAHMREDAAKYLSSLRVNSNGDMIVPLFQSVAAQQVQEKQNKNKVYWSMARGNEDVFNKLVKYGWLMWLLIALTVVSIVLVAVFSSSRVQATLKK